MKTIFLHIGYEKTGTTSIQAYLHNHGSALEQMGVLYPESGRHNIAHFGLVDSLLWETKQKHLEFIPESDHYDMSVWTQLKEEIDKFSGDKVIISSEHFSSRLDQRGVKLLADQLKGVGHLKILFYVRRQDTLVESHYSTMIRSGNSVSIDDVLTRARNKGRYFNYLELIRPWKEVFGLELIFIRPFDKQTTRIGVVKDFLEATTERESFPGNIGSVHRNKSFHPLSLLVGAKLNGNMKDADFFKKSKTVRALNEMIEQMPKYDHLKKASLMSAEERSEIARIYEEDNLSLFRDFNMLRYFSDPLDANEDERPNIKDFDTAELMNELVINCLSET